jgi:hypothetical protein
MGERIKSFSHRNIPMRKETVKAEKIRLVYNAGSRLMDPVLKYVQQVIQTQHPPDSIDFDTAAKSNTRILGNM